MSVSLSGLLSGIDTSSLISQLVEVESAGLYRYQTRLEGYEAEESGLSELETLLETLQSNVDSLYDYDNLKSYEATSTDEDIITATASSDAFEGTHSVEINQLATAERWVHSDGLEYEEDTVGAGTFIYSYNNVETSLTTTEDTTLEGLVDLINNDANNPGVSASLLYYNDTYHLVLNGEDAGSDYSISVNSSNTEVLAADLEFTVDEADAGVSSKLTSLDNFSGDLNGSESITINGTDHDGVAITEVTLDITENTKISHIVSEINDAFDGVAVATYENGEITLTDLQSGESSLTLELAFETDGVSTADFDLPDFTVSTEGGSITSGLTGFSESDFVETQSAQDSLIRVDGYPSGDWISRSSNTIDDVIEGVSITLHDTGTVSVGLSRDTEELTETMTALVEAYNNVVDYIDDNTGYDASTGESSLFQGDYTVTSIKSQLRTSIISATAGFIVDSDSYTSPGLIGLEIDDDGSLSFDTSVFKEAVADDYTGVLELIAAAKTGSTDSNNIEFYASSEDHTEAGTYEVKAEYDASGDLSAVWIRLENESESDWREMTVNGNTAYGISTFTDGNTDYPENSLALTVSETGTANSTTTATLNVKQGFAGDLLDTIDKMLEYSTGSLVIAQDEISDKINEVEDKIEDEEDRLERYETRLTARYARLEKQLALLENQMSALGISTSS